MGALRLQELEKEMWDIRIRFLCRTIFRAALKAIETDHSRATPIAIQFFVDETRRLQDYWD